MDWEIKDNKLVREYTFETFTDAIRFINAVAVFVDEQDHHPEIWNSYTTVRLTLTTHDDGDKITPQDYALASVIDEIKI